MTGQRHLWLIQFTQPSWDSKIREDGVDT